MQFCRIFPFTHLRDESSEQTIASQWPCLAHTPLVILIKGEGSSLTSGGQWCYINLAGGGLCCGGQPPSETSFPDHQVST